MGWAEKNGKFDGVYQGRDKDGEIVYFASLRKDPLTKTSAQCWRALRPSGFASCRMIAARKSPRRARWVKPVVLVDAEFRGKTADRLLWHPSFQGVREEYGIKPP